MKNVINAQTLRADLSKIMARVRRGERFTVVYRRRPICEMIPISQNSPNGNDIESDPLLGAEAVGASTDGRTAADHDEILYGKPRR